jgi:ATP-dependent protease ClpP protease subunit
MQKLYLFGLIASDSGPGLFGGGGDTISAKMVTDFLGGLQPQEQFEAYIDSPGGDVFEGLAIYNLLSEYSNQLTVKVIGEASSIASVVACAGNKTLIAESALMMIHKPWLFACLNEDYILELQQKLTTIKESIITAYARKTAMSAAKINDMMTAGAFHNAKDCVKLGFADAIYVPSQEESTQAQTATQNNMAAYNKHFFTNLMQNPAYPLKYAALAAVSSNWKLNQKCVTNAKKLISTGNYDATSSWNMTPADEDKILGNPPDFKKYSLWHLGIDAGVNQDTKGAYSYPLGKDGKVFKRALVAIEGYATKNNETEIHDAAANLIQLIDTQEANKSNIKSYSVHIFERQIMTFNNLDEAVNHIGTIELQLTTFKSENEQLKATTNQITTENESFKNQITEKDTLIADLANQNFIHEAKAFCEEMFNAKKLTRAEINGSADITKELPAKVTKLVDLRKADEKLYSNECEDIKNRTTTAMDGLGDSLPGAAKMAASNSWKEKFLDRIENVFNK